MTQPPTGSTPADLRCSRNEDCVWGFFSTDIASPDDCRCRVCPHEVLNRKARERHNEQYAQHCRDLVARRPCPKGKCRRPPYLACVAGRCQTVDEP